MFLPAGIRHLNECQVLALRPLQRLTLRQPYSGMGHGRAFGILLMSVSDRVCQGFAQCDFNVALSLRNTAVLAHEPIHEGEIAATSLGKVRFSSIQGRLGYGL